MPSQQVVVVHCDEEMRCLRWRFSTPRVVLTVGSIQLLVTLLSLAQHVYSVARFQRIFYCMFLVYNDAVDKSVDEELQNRYDISKEEFPGFMQVDFIIYDFGLYHELWNITNSIANHIDDGYCRGLWCLGYLAAFVFLLLALCLPRPHPLLLYPILTMQSTYCIGMLILSFAGLPKLFKLLFSIRDPRDFGLILAFVGGMVMNFILNYVLWHLFWHLETLAKRRQLGERRLPDTTPTSPVHVTVENYG